MPVKKKTSKKQPSELKQQVAVVEWATTAVSLFPDLQLLHSTPNEIQFTCVKNKEPDWMVNRWLGHWLNKSGRRKGFPDLSLPVARAGYIGWHGELKKSYTEEVRKEQEWWLDELGKQGYFASAFFHSQEMIDSLAWYVSQPRTVTIPPTPIYIQEHEKEMKETRI